VFNVGTAPLYLLALTFLQTRLFSSINQRFCA